MKLSSNTGDTFLDSGALGESALDELNIVWDQWGYGNVAVEIKNKEKIINMLLRCLCMNKLCIITKYHRKVKH
jgi:hypothetical protein